MLAKLHKTHGIHRNYLKPKSDINTSFGLNHFAGVVFYDTRGILFDLFYQATVISYFTTVCSFVKTEGSVVRCVLLDNKIEF